MFVLHSMLLQRIPLAVLSVRMKTVPRMSTMIVLLCCDKKVFLFPLPLQFVAWGGILMVMSHFGFLGFTTKLSLVRMIVVPILQAQLNTLFNCTLKKRFCMTCGSGLSIDQKRLLVALSIHLIALTSMRKTRITIATVMMPTI